MCVQKIKVRSQSVQKLEWKRTDRRTDGADCIIFFANAVGGKIVAHGRSQGDFVPEEPYASERGRKGLRQNV